MHPDSRMARFDRAAEKVLKWVAIGAGIAGGLFLLLTIPGVAFFSLAFDPSYSRYQAIAGSNQADFIYIQGRDNYWKLYIPSQSSMEIPWLGSTYERGDFADVYWTNDGAVLVIMVAEGQKKVLGYAYDFTQKKELGIDCGDKPDPAKNAAITQQIQQLVDLHGGLKQPGIDVRKEARHIYSWQVPD